MNKNHTSAKFLTSMIQNNTGLNLMHISSNIYESMTLYVNCMDIFVAEATTTRSFFQYLVELAMVQSLSLAASNFTKEKLFPKNQLNQDCSNRLIG